jgi:hypothetical protein
VLFSDLEKYWRDVRDVIESYATKYVSPSTPPAKYTAQQLMEGTAALGVQVGRLWYQGLTIAAKEAGRVYGVALATAKDSAKQQERAR